jgi:YD repeat-containing protein
MVRDSTFVSFQITDALTAANIAYDAANELLRWNNATNNMTYDLNGNLATETVSGVTTTYTWDCPVRVSAMVRHRSLREFFDE